MKKETRKEELSHLAEKVLELDAESQFLDYEISGIMDKIKKLNPNKKEIEELKIKDLFSEYNF